MFLPPCLSSFSPHCLRRAPKEEMIKRKEERKKSCPACKKGKGSKPGARGEAAAAPEVERNEVPEVLKELRYSDRNSPPKKRSLHRCDLCDLCDLSEIFGQFFVKRLDEECKQGWRLIFSFFSQIGLNFGSL